MSNLKDTIHKIDNDCLIHEFHIVAEYSQDDEFIQILLSEIKNRNLTIEEVLKDVLH